MLGLQYNVGFSLVAMRGPLIAVVSFAAEHRLSSKELACNGGATGDTGLILVLGEAH